MNTEHKNLKELTPDEMTKVLQRNSHAHLGCHHLGETYVCPITYVYEGNCIYSHSLLGKKIKMMRANPKVCVQVEEVNSLFSWKSVIVWGRFEELTGDIEAEVGLRLLKQKIAHLAEVEASRKVSDLEVQLDAILSHAKIYRIEIEKMTGRGEGSD